MNMTTHLPQVPKLRIYGAIPIFPATPFVLYSGGYHFESPPWHYPSRYPQSLHTDTKITLWLVRDRSLSNPFQIIRCPNISTLCSSTTKSVVTTNPSPGIHHLDTKFNRNASSSGRHRRTVRYEFILCAEKKGCRRGTCVACVQVSLTSLCVCVIVPPTCKFCPHRTCP
jgi:hypothetical protein